MIKNHIRIKSFTAIINHSEERSLFQPEQDSNNIDVKFSTPRSIVHISFKLSTNQPTRLNNESEQYFVLGDDQDVSNDVGMQFLGNGLMLRCNQPDQEIEISSSITGLPAIFIYRDNRVTVIASDIQNIAAISGLHLQFDAKGLIDLATIGHPINHRTLFKNLTIIPAGSLLKLINGQAFEIVETWLPPGEPQFSSWPEYIDAQISATKAAIHRLDLSQSFLSLTAGLDTRAILAMLIQEGARVPAYTMSGERVTLDAMRARQLCDAYGMSHNNVSINTDFADGLPGYATEASRLSGGLESVGQAFEVYFYKSLPGQLHARISGNLGNQIGRSGTEGTGMRNVSLDILSPDLKAGIVNSPSREHWFNEIFPDQQMMHPQFLIQNENLYASVGNYSIGNHFAVQQTPYADRSVIGQKLRQPPNPHQGSKPDAIWQIKLRDVRHRFLGQPVAYSFQRKVVKDTGGFVANCPINWGWRARGGVSLGGLMYGAMAMTDAVLGSKLGKHPIPNNILKAVGIKGLSSFQEVNILANPKTKQFVADTLLSAGSRQSGILESRQLELIVESGLSDTRQRSNLEFALDVALAQHNFKAT